MDFDRLKMFVAIVEEGSLTGAAKRLEITQPAVSRSLKLLEENLGVELFERVGRGLQITAGGRALLARAQEVLDQLERVEREVGPLFLLLLGRVLGEQGPGEKRGVGEAPARGLHSSIKFDSRGGSCVRFTELDDGLRLIHGT